MLPKPSLVPSSALGPASCFLGTITAAWQEPLLTLCCYFECLLSISCALVTAPDERWRQPLPSAYRRRCCWRRAVVGGPAGAPSVEGPALVRFTLRSPLSALTAPSSSPSMLLWVPPSVSVFLPIVFPESEGLACSSFEAGRKVAPSPGPCWSRPPGGGQCSPHPGQRAFLFPSPRWSWPAGRTHGAP